MITITARCDICEREQSIRVLENNADIDYRSKPKDDGTLYAHFCDVDEKNTLFEERCVIRPIDMPCRLRICDECWSRLESRLGYDGNLDFTAEYHSITNKMRKAIYQ